MHILLISATAAEIRPLLDTLGSEMPALGSTSRVSVVGHELDVLITGLGMMHAAFHIGSALEGGRYDHVIMAGIAGTYNEYLAAGSVVQVVRHAFGDLGAVEEDGFKDMFEKGLVSSELYTGGWLHNDGPGSMLHPKLPRVNALSVNCVTGSRQQASVLASRSGAELEVMEGIALHYACRYKRQPYSEVRSISNLAGEPDRTSWDINTAIDRLNEYILRWLGGEIHN